MSSSPTLTLFVAILLGWTLAGGHERFVRQIKRELGRRQRRRHSFHYVDALGRPTVLDAPRYAAGEVRLVGLYRGAHDPGHPLNCGKCNPWAPDAPPGVRRTVKRATYRILGWLAPDEE